MKLLRKLFTKHPTLILFLLISSGLFAQHYEKEPDGSFEKVRQAASAVYGHDDKLINGVLYYPLHYRASGHPYYPQSEFVHGSLYTGGQAYHNESIKYNIEIQGVILKKKISENALTNILLNNNLIDSFSIDGRKFINTRYIFTKDSLRGFVELIYRGNFELLAWHSKIFKSDYNRKTPYGRHQKMPVKYTLLKKHEWKTINSKKEFLKELYGRNHRKVKRIMKKLGIKYKQASSADLNKIIINSKIHLID